MVIVQYNVDLYSSLMVAGKYDCLKVQYQFGGKQLQMLNTRYETDRKQVPWGKGEKYFYKNVKERLKLLMSMPRQTVNTRDLLGHQSSLLCVLVCALVL